MSSPAPSLARFVFGPFEFDASSEELRKHGTRLRLPGQPARILTILVNRPGQVITREELQRDLWRETTFVDFEQGLNAAMNKLRQALSDDASQPRYIETIPGRGYRFIAPVERKNAKPVVEMAPQTGLRLEPARSRRSRGWLIWLSGAAILGVAAASYWLGGRPGATAPAGEVTIVAVAAPAGFAFEGAASRQGFALSPDGSRLAFTAIDASGEQTAFIREFSALEARKVPESEGASTLWWPPDGQSLFLSVRGKLRRIARDGASQTAFGESPSFLVSGTAIREDTTLLSNVATSYFASNTSGELVPANAHYLWPQMLPDGEHLLYVERDTRAGHYWARVKRLSDAGPGKGLLEADSKVMFIASAFSARLGYLLYVRAGVLLASPFDPGALRVTGQARVVVAKLYWFAPIGAADFSVSNKGTIAYQSYTSRSQLVWVDRKGRQIAATSAAGINVKSGRISPDGSKLAAAIYDVERGEQNLWIVDLLKGDARLLTPEKGLRDAPAWAPDSKRLAYLLGTSGLRPGTTLRGLGNSDSEETLPHSRFQMPTDWSPDGRFVVYGDTGMPRLENETQGDIYVVDLAHGRAQIPLLNSPFHESSAAFSPDGKYLAFMSNETGRAELYVREFRADPQPHVVGERRLVSRNGAVALRWRRDGRELFYQDRKGQVWAVPVSFQAEPHFGEGKALFTIGMEARAAIHSVPGFDVAADGSKFVIPVVSDAPGPSIIVVRDWEAALAKRP